MGQIWDFLIVQPIGHLLRVLYEFTGNYGVALMFVALAAKLLLLWFAYKGKRGMLQQQRLQPKIQELQKKYGTDKQRMQQEQAKLYQSEGISMFGGCIWMLIPFPIIIALFGAVRRPLQYIWGISENLAERLAIWFNGLEGYNLEEVNWNSAREQYEFGGSFELELANRLGEGNHFANAAVEFPVLANEYGITEAINFEFLGMNIAQVPNFTSLLVIIPLLSAISAFGSAFFTQKFSGRPPAAGNSQLIMYLVGPIISLWIGFTWPAALGVYWITQNLLGLPQEYFLTKHWNRKLDADEAEKEAKLARRKAAEAAHKAEERERRAERIAEQNKKHKPKRYKVRNEPVSLKKDKSNKGNKTDKPAETGEQSPTEDTNNAD